MLRYKFAYVLSIVAMFVVANGVSLGSNLKGSKIVAVKVAYLYYFSKFVTWPQHSDLSDSYIHLCVTEVSEKMAFQLSTIQGKKVVDKQLDVIYLLDGDKNQKKETEELIKKCHVLYVSPELEAWYMQIQYLIPSYTLVVAESANIKGAMIILHLLNRKLSFEIDALATESGELKISSKLLKLSRRRQK